MATNAKMIVKQRSNERRQDFRKGVRTFTRAVVLFYFSRFDNENNTVGHLKNQLIVQLILISYPQLAVVPQVLR